MSDISKEAMVKNGMDIVEALPEIPVDMLLDSVVGSVHSHFVHYLNHNGFPLAAQKLDDAWHDRDEQWWRQPNEFDTQYRTGEDMRREYFG